MLKNYFLIAIRSFFKDKAYAVINIAGLITGIFSALVILLYADYQLGYDKFHVNHKEIYRVAVSYKANSGVDVQSAMSPSGLAPKLVQHFNGARNAVRLLRYQGSVVVQNGEKKDVFNENNIFRTDPGLFRMFTYPMILGNPSTALSRPYSIVISEKLAIKYFGTAEVLNKVVSVDGENHTITGVMEDAPENSDLYCEGFTTYDFGLIETWNNLDVYTYVQLNNQARYDECVKAIDNLMNANSVALEMYSMNSKLKGELQSLSEVHFVSGYADDTPKGYLTYIYILLVIGVLIIVLVVINYINLSVLKSIERTREVAIRKSLGAQKGQLVIQFFMEAVTVTLFSFVASVLLLAIFMPLTNRSFDIALSLSTLIELRILFAMAALVLIVGIVSAAYPAIFLSSMNISKGVKGRSSLPGTQTIRKVLLVVQFGISTMAIASTFIINGQMNFLWSQPLGFDKDQTMVVEVPTLTERELYTLRKEIINSSLKSASVVGANDYPGGKSTPWQVVWTFDKEHRTELAVNIFYVDENFMDLLSIPLVSGRLFEPETNKADYVHAIIVNERFVQGMGWTKESAIGQRIVVFDNHWDIIGVAKDFHYQSLSNEIEPLFLAMVNKEWPLEKKLLVKVRSKADVEQVQAKWKSITQDPMVFTFLDEDFSKYYVNEQALAKMASYFSGISLLLAAVGLIGLASLLTLQRTKEIGIRKIMGSTNAGIFLLLLKDFIVFACIGYVISIPLTWTLMSTWLSYFPFRIPLGTISLILPALIIFFVTVSTTGYQILKGALINPVDTLRHE